MRTRLAKTFCIFGFFVASIAGSLADQPYNPASPAVGWNGPYVGAYAGRTWADVDFSTDAGDLTPTSFFWSQVNIDSVSQVATGPASGDANVGGVVVGFNAQQGQWVFGLEADVGAFNLRIGRGGGEPYPDPASAPFAHVSSAVIETDRLVTARARVGWTPRSDLLIYATAGLAVTTVRITNSFSDDAPEDGVGGASNSDTRAGLAFGGGAEWALSRNWSLKAEYLFMDFGSVTTRSSITCGPGGAAICAFFNVTPNQFDTTADLTAHVARIGLNYRF